MQHFSKTGRERDMTRGIEGYQGKNNTIDTRFETQVCNRKGEMAD